MGKVVVCVWPVTEDRPDHAENDCGNCPEPNCEGPSGHGGNHQGRFDADDLEVVPTVQ